jgi:hypothetical protein
MASWLNVVSSRYQLGYRQGGSRAGPSSHFCLRTHILCNKFDPFETTKGIPLRHQRYASALKSWYVTLHGSKNEQDGEEKEGGDGRTYVPFFTPFAGIMN